MSRDRYTTINLRFLSGPAVIGEHRPEARSSVGWDDNVIHEKALNSRWPDYKCNSQFIISYSRKMPLVKTNVGEFSRE